MAREDRGQSLLQGELRAVNVGLEVFYESLLSQKVPTVHVDWRPPAGGDEKLASLLDKLSGRRPGR